MCPSWGCGWTIYLRSTKFSPLNIAIIGGGAAGFFAAIKCAEDNPNIQVSLYEKNATVLNKVLISGGGRCNVTHACFNSKELATHYPRGGRALLGPFSRFQPKDTVQWFEKRAVKLKTESDGRIFPTTDNSETISYVLQNSAREAGVHVHTGIKNLTIKLESPSKFKMYYNNGDPIYFDRLLLATGSAKFGINCAVDMGHSIEPQVPSLFTMCIRDKGLTELSGISVENAQVKVLGTKLKQTGALLITHWGLSGPTILKLSAWGARILHEKRYKVTLEVNWIGKNAEVVQEKIKLFKRQNANRQIRSHNPFSFPQRLWMFLVEPVRLTEEQRWSDLSNKQCNQLVQSLTAYQFHTNDKSTFKDEFVTCGGIKLSEVDFKTMESKKCKGLYFAGEILDIDGVTGGFNFQSAWTTGWLAGKAMANEN